MDGRSGGTCMRKRIFQSALTVGICPTTIGHLFDCIAAAQGGEPCQTRMFWAGSNEHVVATTHARYVPSMDRRNPHRDKRATPEEFAAWLRDQLARRGYDLRPRGGGQTRFAADSGIAQSSISRMLRGQGAPETRVLETLAETLDLPLAEVLVAAGILTRDVLHAIRQQNPRTAPLTPEAAAEELGITDPQKVELFVSMTETLRKQRAKNGEGNIAEN